VERRFREGHFGLRLLNDLVADAGGRLEVEPAPQGGTVVSVSLARLAHSAGVA
jgi:signal transduction histidine kinase